MAPLARCLANTARSIPRLSMLVAMQSSVHLEYRAEHSPLASIWGPAVNSGHPTEAMTKPKGTVAKLETPFIT